MTEKTSSSDFGYDNARLHTANITKSVNQELGWEVVAYPDLTPSDLYLALSLSNSLRKNFLMTTSHFKNKKKFRIFHTNRKIYYEAAL